jgi:catechol 2,3-dioxygenase-like lactoylglutathione lyase family enzyme
MKTSFWKPIACCLLTFTAGSYAAEWDHIHLLVPDTKEAMNWYAEHFDGKTGKAGPFDAVWFDDNLVKFRKSKPDTKGTVGSAIHHIGFAVPNVAEKIAELKDAGVNVVLEEKASGAGFHYGFVSDPWGTLIELMDDTSVTGLHHIHLHSPNAKETTQWYADTFGGEITTYEQLPGFYNILYENVWLVVQQSGSVEPTTGRIIDHLGWRFEDYDAALKKFKEDGVEFALEPRPKDHPMMAYILGPDGVKIEVVRKGE